MASEKSTSRTLKTADTTCKVLTAIRELEGVTLTELADYLDLSPSGVHHYLSTLRENQFVVKSGNEYHLSSKFLMMGEYVRQRSPLYQVGRDEIRTLAEETEEHAHLMTEEFGLGVHLFKARGDGGAAAEFYRQKVQKPDYLHLSAAGKAILAFMEEERVDEIIERYGHVEKTANTITDRDELLDELETIREQGYALNDEEEVRGTRAVGAAILDTDGKPRGGISVSGPTSRIDDGRFEKLLPKDVMRTANIIEATLESKSGFQ
jgi:DNA-binding IclR family transcriptional regulator